MLNILTNIHLPGIHAKVLETNVDVGVFMSCIQESMPAVWSKIDDTQEMQNLRSRANPNQEAVGLQLPTAHLATTAWFMSCFLGNMPVESVLRIWDCLFYEGSKTLFRISLAILKVNEQEIRDTKEQLEIFQVVQSLPRRLLDINGLMETCFKRRNGFGHLTQELIDERRKRRRKLVRRERDEKDWERMQQEQEQQARTPISAQIPPLPSGGRERGMTIGAVHSMPTTSTREPPPLPPPPTVSLGPVQTTSNPMRLPLSPVELPPSPRSPFSFKNKDNPMVLPPSPLTDASPRPSMDDRGRARDVDARSVASTGAFRSVANRARSQARAIKERSRSRKRERAKNWTDTEWRDAI